MTEPAPSAPRPPPGLLGKAFWLLRHDRPALAAHVKRKLLTGWCALHRRSGFYVQGRMDIDPRGWWHNPAFVAATGGYFIPDDPVKRAVLELEPWDTTRRDMIILLLRSLVERHIEGDLAELGVYKGATARLIHHYLPERPLYLFDTFSGFDARDVQAERAKTGLATAATHFSDTSLALVLRTIAPQNDNVRAFPGFFPESVPPALAGRRFALAHLDADLYDPILAGLEFFHPRMSPGGFILVHDYNSWPGARRAVQDFFRDKPETPIPMPDKSGSALIVKLPPA